jgi:hypothetical protein
MDTLQATHACRTPWRPPDPRHQLQQPQSKCQTEGRNRVSALALVQQAQAAIWAAAHGLHCKVSLLVTSCQLMCQVLAGQWFQGCCMHASHVDACCGRLAHVGIMAHCAVDIVHSRLRLVGCSLAGGMY